jgi:D-3-phosphoglycerate dehydrogenase / 2-oxoglutarate reductase
LSDTNRPVIWIGEPVGFSLTAKTKLEQHFTLICKSVNQAELKEVFQLCDVFIFRLGLKVVSDTIQMNQRCKLIATPVTGLNHIDLDVCKKNQIQIISLKGEFEFLKQIRATAEFTMALLLCLVRNIVPASANVNEGIFDRDLFRGNELFQKTIGIIGFGRLGKIVSEYALAFGMKVLIYERNVEKITDQPEYQFVDLESVLENSDFISLHIDASEENDHFVNAKFLSKMKKSAFLINTSRGSILDEEALVKALVNKQISGAALDVVQGEPHVDFNKSIFKYAKKHTNLLITPHLGGNTHESVERTECFIADKIIQNFRYA